jgi:serine/threonine-protein kinase RsbW/stage II sporulation protein AB (anti-sigma F factor)
MTGPAAASLGAPSEKSYPAIAASVAIARRAVGRRLHALPEDALMIGDVELAVSEACTNVVLHAYRDREVGAFRVLVQRAVGLVRVTVSDDGSGMKPRPDSPGLGLGLPTMAALTDHLDVGTAGDGTGTVVCMHFSAAGAHARLSSPRRPERG